jgi:N-acetylneuraminate synthase
MIQLDSFASRNLERILIVGKGASAFLSKFRGWTGSLLISANDACHQDADITVLTNPDIELGKIEIDLRRDSILISPLRLESEKVIRVASDLDPEDSNLDLLRKFGRQEITYTGQTVLLCLRVAEEIARRSKQQIQTFLIGFDFEQLESEFQSRDSGFVEASLKEQFRSLSFLQSSETKRWAEIVHVGNSSLSGMSIQQFNALREATGEEFQRAAHTSEVDIVAEITTNHFGDWGRLEKMIRRSWEAGANSIKLQKRNPLTFYTSEKLESPYESPFGRTFRDYRLALELSVEQFEKVNDLCESLGLNWFTSVLDIESFNFMLQFSPARIKLPSTISEHKSLLDHVSKNFASEVVVSTGYTDASYESKVLDLFGKVEKLYLLQCVSAYPAKSTETQIAVVRHYRDLSQRSFPNLAPGYSSHDIGSLVSSLAVAAGAKMIEKHVKLGDTPWAHFDNVAVDLATEDFPSFVGDIRHTEAIMGSELKEVKSSEHHKYWLKRAGRE